MALRRLEDEHDYGIAEGSTDIRGWTLEDAAGTDVGRITHLLFDPGDEHVKYAAAEIHGRQVLLPVNFLEIDEDHQRVVSRGYTRDMLAALRPYDEDVWDEEEELKHYRGYVPVAVTEEPDYEREPFRRASTWRVEPAAERYEEPLAREPEVTFTSAEPTEDFRAREAERNREEPLF